MQNNHQSQESILSEQVDMVVWRVLNSKNNRKRKEVFSVLNSRPRLRRQTEILH